jgi:hypothetical protein
VKTRLKFRRIILAALGSICLGSWSAVCVGFFVRFSLRAWTGIVAAAAVSTEMLFWALTAVLGVTVLQARRRRAGSLKAGRRGATGSKVHPARQ